MGLVYRPITGLYLNVDGTPKYGSIEFTPTTDIYETNGALYPLHTVIMYLDDTGRINGELAATDSTGMQPEGWLWSIEEKIENGDVWWMALATEDLSVIDINTLRGINVAPPSTPVQGPAGPMGPPGSGGTDSDINSGIWRWTTKTTDASTPGQVGNNAGVSWDAVEIHINQQKEDNTNVSVAIEPLTVGDQIRIQQKTDDTRWGLYNVTMPPVDNGTWWFIQVDLVDFLGATPNNSTEVLVTFITESGGGTGGGSGGVFAQPDEPPSEDFDFIWVDIDDTTSVPPSGGGGGISQEDADLRYVNVSGDTVTGTLYIPSGPGEQPLEAVNLQVLDGKLIDYLKDEDAIATYLDRVQGGTMAGPLFLWRDPQSGTEAATRLYVDNRTPPIVKGTVAPTDLTAIWVDTN